MLEILERFYHPIRIAQGALSLLILCLLAYAASNWSWWWSPESINFLIFTSVWTILVIIALVFGPSYFPIANYKFVTLAIESTTMLFWFAGFIALTSFISEVGCSKSSWGPCRASTAGVIFSAIEW